ncbi:uncharacterized protein LOC134209290 [Armigeres subalbatus]|uniref:uncharacterized protein LOC134209290 n=1 Tax=Armigeres subalbatus TaxID=124917 RepID=UPI002ED030E1
MEEILAGCEGTVCYLDDIYVEGENLEQHNTRLKVVYERLQKRGLILNQEKCVIGASEVQFIGHIISPSGIRPSPSKVEALKSFRRPVNATEVKSFLGLANYMNKFISDLSTLDEPLRRLTEHSVKFEWTNEQQSSFEAIKNALSGTACLGYYNVNHPTSVIVDASPNALGAVLVQTNESEEHRVICYASKSLTRTEKRYCQTEKEALAAVWGVERFQMYLLGKKFYLVTDCEKNVADVLSRLSTLEPKPFDYSEELFVNEIANAAASNVAIRWEELEHVCSQNDEIQDLLKKVENGRLFELPTEYRVIAQELCRVVPMSRRDLPSGPWQDIAIDFMGPLPEGQFLLVVVDYYSRYFEVCEMTSITAECTISELRTIFCRFGIPVTITADNAPQLSEECELFSQFCHSHGIKLINTVPYWPQMNGEVERQNRTILKRLQISQELGQDWRIELQKFLLVYRASNHSTTGRSPAELMFGRKIRTKLPQLTYTCVDDDDTRHRDAVQKEKGKQYSDNKRRAKVGDLVVGDKVFLKRMKKENKLSTEFVNEEFVVLKKCGGDVTVKSLVSGKEYRRNIAHMKRIENCDTETLEDGFLDAETVASPKSDLADESSVMLDNSHASAAHAAKRKRKEPAWFANYMPHFIKKS